VIDGRGLKLLLRLLLLVALLLWLLLLLLLNLLILGSVEKGAVVGLLGEHEFELPVHGT